jgi:hypothetical protein
MTDMDMPLPEPDAEILKLAREHAPVIYTNRHFPDAPAFSFPSSKLIAFARAYAAAEVAKERENLRAAIMAKHEAANGQHNLYHCLVVELFGDEAIRAAAPPQCTAPPSEPV